MAKEVVKKVKAGLTSGKVSGPLHGAIAPRKRDYSFIEDGRPISKISADNKIINPNGPPVELQRPSCWTEGQFVARLLPMVDPDSGEFEAYRQSLEPGAFSDFWRCYAVVPFMGLDQQFSFIAYRKTKSYDPKTNPYVILQSAATQAFNNDEKVAHGWKRIIEGTGKKDFKKLPRVEPNYFAQGLLLQKGKKLFVGRDSDGIERTPLGAGKKDVTQLFWIGKGPGDKMLALFNAVKKGYRGDPSDFEAAMVHGDPLLLSGGRFLNIFNPQVVDAESVLDDVDDTEVEEGSFGSGDERDNGRQKAMSSYEVKMLEEFRVGKRKYTPNLAGKIDENLLRSRVVQWPDVLYFPCHEEICEWLALAFKSVPRLLQFGWQDHREFFTEDVQAILKNRTTVAVSADSEDEDDGEDYEDGGGDDVVDVSAALDEDADVVENDVEDAEVVEAEVEEGDAEDYDDDDYEDVDPDAEAKEDVDAEEEAPFDTDDDTDDEDDGEDDGVLSDEDEDTDTESDPEDEASGDSDQEEGSMQAVYEAASEKVRGTTMKTSNKKSPPAKTAKKMPAVAAKTAPSKKGSSKAKKNS